MSTESNFINELKYDVKKDNIKQFIFKNISIIISITLIIFLGILFYIFLNIYKSNKIQSYNDKLFEILESEDQKEELKKMYFNNKIPRISKTLAGLNLVAILDNNENEIMEEIYNDIFKNEKELFFKYYAGLNLLVLKINLNRDNKEIEDLLRLLEDSKNPLLNLVLEQKALFLKSQGKNEESKNIFNELLKSNLDINFTNRINQYLLNFD